MLLLAMLACGAPDIPDEQVGFRDGSDGGATSGERGTVKITEVLWSGSVREDASWDPSDVFIELRNESARSVNLSGWRIKVEGTNNDGWRLPATDFKLPVGREVLISARADGCFPDAEFVLPQLRLPVGDPFEITLQDADERLIESAGSEDEPPFAGGYDLVTSRSMERIQLMFGGEGGKSQSWHYYNRRDCPEAVRGDDPANDDLYCFEDHPNNDRMKPECRRHTLASPGRPNSADYSGAYANGSFE